MSIMTYNGSAILAAVGEDCVGIASDRMLGVRLLGLSREFQRLFPINERVCVGLPGLATDVDTLYETIRMRTNLYKLEEGRDIGPTKFSYLLSNILYEHRFGPYFCEPIISGLEKNGSPFVCCMDTIGCITTPSNYVTGGSASYNLKGCAEALWEPGLDADALFETMAQIMLSAVDRDCLSGWGCQVKIYTHDSIITRDLRARTD